jgi:predicted  nucleic acid-binding Zn-ribbon protein
MLEEPPELEGVIVPSIVKLETRSEKCGICLGAIKTGLLAVKCTCGKFYHDTCAERVGECPSCENKFDVSKMVKPEEEEEEIRDMELPDDMEAFVKKKEKTPSTKAQMTPKDKKAEILAGLDERLAKGEISEETYLMLRKKYED